MSYTALIENHILFDGSIGTNTRVWYYTSTFLYSPSGEAIQSWGAFDGFSATGDIFVADYYVRAIIEYMLAQLFNDREAKYLFELQKLKNNRINTAPDQTTYSMG